MLTNDGEITYGRRIRRSTTRGFAVTMAVLMSVVAITGCFSRRIRQPEVVAENNAGAPILRPGLMLNIRVFVAGEVEIEQEGKRIGTDGRINLPLLGGVKVAGFTLERFTELLRLAYDSRYLVNPQVEVEFATESGENAGSPWGYVTVLGCVKNSGRVDIPPTQDLRVSRAIQQAGGFEKAAKQSSILVTRSNGDGTSKRVVVDLHDVGSKGEADMDIVLLPGDVVFVPESMF